MINKDKISIVFTIRKMRERKLNEYEIKGGKCLYWMSREQRVNDNHALLYANKIAKKELYVAFCITESFLEANLRHYEFMIDGLKEVEKNLSKLNIPFYLLSGNPYEEIAKFIEENNISAVVGDFDPLKIKRKWKEELIKRIEIPFIEVDAHNIVPCWIASDKQEYSSATFRAKIKKILKNYLKEFPKIKKRNKIEIQENKWEKIYNFLKINKEVKPVNWIKGGESNALKMLERFKKKVKYYAKYRNDPNKDALSNLSPYLHFGNISAQRCALEIKDETFLDEIIVRKEIADNFCYYNEKYDSFNGFPSWAKETLRKHEKDKREYVYSLNEFENAKTHDKLWNSAQIQMVKYGKMHGYMRMYWAKKILEWTEGSEKALEIAIYLNNKYEIDGRDPNGYAGCAWAIGGVHDRPFKERKISGKIRYMSYEGCARKFDVEKYIYKFMRY